MFNQGGAYSKKIMLQGNRCLRGALKYKVGV